MALIWKLQTLIEIRSLQRARVLKYAILEPRHRYMNQRLSELQKDLDELAIRFAPFVVLKGGDIILETEHALQMLDVLTKINIKVASLGSWKYANRNQKDKNHIIEVPHTYYDAPFHAVNPYDANRYVRQFIEDKFLNDLLHEVELVDLDIEDQEVSNYLLSKFREIFDSGRD